MPNKRRETLTSLHRVRPPGFLCLLRGCAFSHLFIHNFRLYFFSMIFRMLPASACIDEWKSIREASTLGSRQAAEPRSQPNNLRFVSFEFRPARDRARGV